VFLASCQKSLPEQLKLLNNRRLCCIFLLNIWTGQTDFYKIDYSTAQRLPLIRAVAPDAFLLMTLFGA
jgi:hypothetical protein